VCHLAGSFRILSESDDLEEVNEALNKNLNEKPSYADLLFGTMTGVTGLLLLIIILLMAITSLN
jgi:hypothetical protein